jgi:hypothetical protein
MGRARNVTFSREPLTARTVMNWFRETHFEYEVSETPRGTRVRVTHLPSGKTRIVDPVIGEPSGEVPVRLQREIESELCAPGDFQTRICRTKEGTVVQVIHRPTGKSRRAERVPKDSTFQTKIELIDEILLELMQEHPQKTQGR